MSGVNYIYVHTHDTICMGPVHERQSMHLKFSATILVEDCDVYRVRTNKRYILHMGLRNLKLN